MFLDKMELPHKLFIRQTESYDILKLGMPTKPLSTASMLPAYDYVDMMLHFLEEYMQQDGYYIQDTNAIDSRLVLTVLLYKLAYLRVEAELATEEEHEFIQQWEEAINIDQAVKAIEEAYSIYKKSLPTNYGVTASLTHVNTSNYGIACQLALPDDFGSLNAESFKRIDIPRSLKYSCENMTSLAALRMMTAKLVSQSPLRSAPSVHYIPNSTLSSFTSDKYSDLLDNSVLQIDTDMLHTSPIDFTPFLANTDVVRSIIGKNCSSALSIIFGEQLLTTHIDSNDQRYAVELMSRLSSIDPLVIATQSMSFVYTPMQQVVRSHGINTLLLSAYYECMGHVAIINNKNSNTPINLLLHYPEQAKADNFFDCICPLLSVIKNRDVRVIFYNTKPEMLSGIAKTELE